jgi:hypothetical protein
MARPMVLRRKPVVVMLTAEELALLSERAAEHDADPYDYAQVLFRTALGLDDDAERDRRTIGARLG